MPVITLKPGEERPVQTPGRFLSIILTSGAFTVSATEFSPLAGKSGRVYTLDNSSQVLFTSVASEDITVEYEQSNVKVESSGGGSVSVENAITVKEILNPTPVDVTAQIEDVRLLQSSVFSNKAHVTIPANSAENLIAANDATNRKVTIQVISAEETDVYIGNSSSVNASNGMKVTGSKEEPGIYVVENTAALFAFNDGTSAATVALVEEYRP